MIGINRTKLNRAIDKAKQEHPRVRALAWRQYSVHSRRGTVNVVSFDIKDGKKVAVCTCKAAAINLPCFHVASAQALHIAVARQRTEASNPTDDQQILVKPQPLSSNRYNGIDI